MSGFILAIDQGTTSSRAIIFDRTLAIRGTGQQEFTQHFPASGWVEHEPDDIWTTTVATAKTALTEARLAAKDIAAVGITNQRETCLLWDRRNGRPIHRAIVWQDRRTADVCARMKREGEETEVATKTGLLLDPYFSATKIAWMLDNVSGARAAADAGHLAFGTVDTFLLWRLTGGKVHATDASNASRTMLYDIRKGNWDDGLLELFNVPRSVLPEVRDSAATYGTTEPAIFGTAIPILGIAGDQQAATIGQACFQPGMMKSTYGTGCFALLNTGSEPVASNNRLLTTVAYQLKGRRTYALEGSIFIAGAAVQWLRDGLKLIQSAHESGALAAGADAGQDVYLVPAFVGLGAPYWNAEARGAIFGLTRNTGPAEFARAALGSRLLSDARSLGRHARRLEIRRRYGAARRRRHGRERLDHAVPRRHLERARRPSDDPGNHGPGRRLARRRRSRRLARPRRLRGAMALAAALHTRHAAQSPRTKIQGLAARRPRDVGARTKLAKTVGCNSVEAEHRSAITRIAPPRSRTVQYGLRPSSLGPIAPYFARNSPIAFSACLIESTPSRWPRLPCSSTVVTAAPPAFSVSAVFFT